MSPASAALFFRPSQKASSVPLVVVTIAGCDNFYIHLYQIQTADRVSGFVSVWAQTELGNHISVTKTEKAAIIFIYLLHSVFHRFELRKKTPTSFH